MAGGGRERVRTTSIVVLVLDLILPTVSALFWLAREGGEEEEEEQQR
jgi:hypothetical protein